MRHRRPWVIMMIVVLWLMGWKSALHAHQDPCHRLHSCLSDHHTYVCGDKGRCDQCPDNHFCLAGKPRVVASPAPAPVPPAPTVTQPSPPAGRPCASPQAGTVRKSSSTPLMEPRPAFSSKPTASPPPPSPRRSSRPTRGVCRCRSSSTRANAARSTPPPTSWPTRACPP
jgi:hypothetical protein